MSPEEVERLKLEFLEWGRRYSRSTDRAAWRDGEPNPEAAANGARMRIAAKAWENAERQLQALTCPPPTLRDVEAGP